MDLYKEQIEQITKNLTALIELMSEDRREVLQPQIDKQNGVCPICNTLLGDNNLNLTTYHGNIVHKECASRDPWKVRDYCYFCLESKEQGATIHTCMFHSKEYGYCPCREDCPAFIHNAILQDLLRKMVNYKCGLGWDKDFVYRELKKISGFDFYKCPECGYLLNKDCPHCQNKVVLPKGEDND